MSLHEFSDNLSTLSYVSRRKIPLWLYDPKKKAFLGRTVLSWTLCILFYIIYYACLGGFFMGMLMAFLYAQVHEDKPSLTGEHSLLNLQAGLSSRPNVDVKRALIKYATTDPQEYLVYTDNIDIFLAPYVDINTKPDSQFAKCEGSTKTPEDPHKVCKFPLTMLDACADVAHGYPGATPCVFLKINKIYGWIPDIKDPALSRDILVTCDGQNPADVENLKELEYFPGVVLNNTRYGAFSTVYFPFLGQPGYLAPLVGVRFKSYTKNMAILIQCQLHNVRNTVDTELKFELLVRHNP